MKSSLLSSNNSTPISNPSHIRNRIPTTDSNPSSASSPTTQSCHFSNQSILDELPPSSPCSGEQQQQQSSAQQLNQNHVSNSDEMIKESNTNTATKNPKMSLENLMLPFDQHVRTTEVPSSIVKQEKSVQITTPKNRSTSSTPPFFTARTIRSAVPTESATSLFANYSFGHNVAHTSPLHTTTSVSGAGGPLLAYNTKQTPTPPPLCTEPKAKRPWTESEDLILRQLVSKLGTGLWAAMAQQIPGRTGKQVRERWLNHLSPGVTKRPWSVEEDNVIIENHKRIGNCWSRIAKLLQGRSDNSVKNRYYTTLRRRIGNAEARNATSRKRYHVDDDAPSKRPRVWE